MDEFIQFVKDSREYTNLVFIHGERLFIRRNNMFEVPAIELAFRAFEHGLLKSGERCDTKE